VTEVEQATCDERHKGLGRELDAINKALADVANKLDRAVFFAVTLIIGQGVAFVLALVALILKGMVP
jgi:hypothetical protein